MINGFDFKEDMTAKKGEFHKMIAELSNKTNITTYLYTESENNVKCFKRYSFDNLGRVGVKSEYLMVLKHNY